MNVKKTLSHIHTRTRSYFKLGFPTQCLQSVNGVEKYPHTLRNVFIVRDGDRETEREAIVVVVQECEVNKQHTCVCSVFSSYCSIITG